ncbi:mitochondrial 54S ribosomal protein YmL31 [Cystobasidium minutum MCA 4210]|uniref:mitochondrial 54S ribosomal protein mL60 n=1 Tax=Cystobasidium minutum MCA 4210 TaxID=1397322 RepID=UPI0034CF0824|eukprot:jgi/Rhomi1/104268/CE104267_1135
MFGAFRASPVCGGGLVWKSPWRMSRTRKANQRKRLKAVDEVIRVVASTGLMTRSLEQALQLPKEHEMDPKDKYTTFSRSAPGYRKSVHKVPKFTRLTLRENPKGF